jgi:hypothetical protein
MITIRISNGKRGLPPGAIVRRPLSRKHRCRQESRRPMRVLQRSAVSMLSLTTIGIPCSGPRGPRARRSRSSASATSQPIGVALDDRVDRRTGSVDRVGAREIRFNQPDRRPRPRTERGLQVGDARLRELERRSRSGMGLRWLRRELRSGIRVRDRGARAGGGFQKSAAIHRPPCGNRQRRTPGSGRRAGRAPVNARARSPRAGCAALRS